MERDGVPLPPDLTVERAEEWVQSRLKKVKPSTVAVEVKGVRALDKWVAKSTTEFPLRSLRIPKVDEPGPMPTSTADDVAKLIRACHRSIGFEAVRDEAMIMLFVATGARRSELARMEVDDVDLQEGVAWLLETKARRPRKADISIAADSMARYLALRARHRSAQSPALWLGRKGPLGVQGAGFAVARREKAAGVKLGTHAFRRGLVVDWLDRGGSQAGLQQVAGWSTGAMVTRYARAHLADLAVKEQRRLFAPQKPPKPKGYRSRPEA